VQIRHVSIGDYVKVGDPAFQIVADDTLSARVFFPEALAGRIQVGLPVALRAGGDQRSVQAQITRLLPALDPSNRSLAVLVDFPNDHAWRPGLSVIAQVSVEARAEAVMTPVRSVVRRPAGSVVYRVEDGRAIEQQVQLGQTDGDWVEILSGLSGDTTVAVDGAGFLTDGAAVEIREQTP
jgi:RND family efflux transporter MFP subunit